VRLAIVSDTHLPRGARTIPDDCLRRCTNADVILHAGDFTSLQVLHLLRSLGPPVHAVHGNVDSPEVRAALPAARVDTYAGFRIAITHDPGPRDGRLARLRRRFPDAQAVVYGHTHIPQLEEHDGFTILNPGSPTERRRAPRHTMGEALIEPGRARFRLIDLD